MMPRPAGAWCLPLLVVLCGTVPLAAAREQDQAPWERVEIHVGVGLADYMNMPGAPFTGVISVRGGVAFGAEPWTRALHAPGSPGVGRVRGWWRGGGSPSG